MGPAAPFQAGFSRSTTHGKAGSLSGIHNRIWSGEAMHTVWNVSSLRENVWRFSWKKSNQSAKPIHRLQGSMPLRPAVQDVRIKISKTEMLRHEKTTSAAHRVLQLLRKIMRRHRVCRRRVLVGRAMRSRGRIPSLPERNPPGATVNRRRAAMR